MRYCGKHTRRRPIVQISTWYRQFARDFFYDRVMDNTTLNWRLQNLDLEDFSSRLVDDQSSICLLYHQCFR